MTENLVTDILIVTAAVLGTFFMVVASLGVLRMPDFFHRVHPPAKSTTLGILLLLVALALESPEPETITKAVLAFLFLALTAPAAIHLLARSAYRRGIPGARPPDPDAYRQVAERSNPAGHAAGTPGHTEGE